MPCAAEARRILVELEAQAGRRQLGVPERPQPMRGTDLVNRWLGESLPRTSNRKAWEQKQRHALVKVWSQLDAIVSREDAQRIARKLDSNGYKPATIRTAISSLKAAWRWAVDEGITDANPWAKLRLPKAESRIEYLSRSEIAALLDAVDKDRDVVAIAVRLALFAGLRVSEVWGLRWRGVDLDRGTLTIRNGYKNAPTKSRRERIVPLADQLRDALSEWQKRCPSREMVCPTTTGEAKAKRLEPRRNLNVIAALTLGVGWAGHVASLAKLHNFARLRGKPIFLSRSVLTAKPIETMLSFVTRSHPMRKDIALIAQHRRPAFVVALLTAATLIGCQEGVTVAVVGIPADTTVSVDTLNLGIARSPAKVYRYKGVGYARVLGVSPAPSYTASARRLDGCVVAVGTTDYNGEDEVQIALKAVEGCKSPAPVPAPAPTPSVDLPDMAPSDMTAPAAPRDMVAPAPAPDMATPQPAVCTPLPPLPPAITVNHAPTSCTTPTRWALDCQLHCPPLGAERIYVAYSWVLATDPLGYKMSRTFYATSTLKDVSNLSVGDVLEYGKCGGLISHTYYNVVKQQLSSSTHGVTPEAAPLLCPGIKNGVLAPWESSFHFYAVVQ